MLQIFPLKAFVDNYIWLWQHENQVIVVDPGQAEPVLAYLATHQLTLTAIWLTHAHADHIGGVAKLCQAYPQCHVLGAADWHGVNKVVAEGSQFNFFDYPVRIWHIPGHTADHLAYLLTDASQLLRVFCGDTLFSAGCGRVFTGTMTQLYHSLQRLNNLPASTWLYPAHEYTAANLRFAQTVEPDNQAIRQALHDASSLPTLPVTLAHERLVNPFLRLQQPQVKAAVMQHGLPRAEVNQPMAVLSCLREWKNHF